MPGKIFVNYRRDDERAFAARVRDRLAQSFGSANVFMDVDNLMAGQRFDRELEKALAETDVFLAVIGPRWLNLYQKRQDTGERDYVHEEIAGALKRGTTVIPVLIEGAALPRGDLLPDDIRDLVLHQKHGVSHENFGRDLNGLIEAIQFSRRAMRQSTLASRLKAGWLALLLAGSVAGIAAAYVGAGWFGKLFPPQGMKSVPEATKEADAATLARKRADAVADAKAKAEQARLAREKAIAEIARLKAAEAARIAPQPGRTFRDCNDGCPEMVVLPAGRFKMGEGRSARDVTVQQAFAVGKFEVTFDEWAACVASGGCTSNCDPNDEGWGEGRRPVINVSWNDAAEYVAWLSRKTGQTYHLLTEVQWEYAARAGTATRYPWGDDVGRGNANCNGCGSEWDRKQTAPVGSFKANAFGLHDMHGNVWEWCVDPYDVYTRVVRGGSWDTPPDTLPSWHRIRSAPDIRYKDLGFRVARVLSPASTP